MTAITSATFISDVTKNLRDRLSSNIVDPISSSRTGRERFVMTSYPQRDVKYPVITVQATDLVTPRKLGHGSQGLQAVVPMELRIWGRNIKERDYLAQQVIHYLRTNQEGASGTQADGMFDFRIVSSETVEEEGNNNPKSWVLRGEYFVILL